MYPGAREDRNVESTQCSGSTGATTNTGPLCTNRTKTQQTSTTCLPQSIMVVHSTPTGEKIHCESYLINTEADRPTLKDNVPGTFPDFGPAKKRYKSTTDIPCPGSVCLLPPCSPGLTDKEQSTWRRCSLNETNNVSRFRRHALSVPNMGSSSPLHFINSSPLHSSPLSPAHSNISSPGREMEKIAKARSKLLESESNQTPRLPPEIRDQLRYVSKDGKCRVNLGHIDERGRFLSDIFTSFVDLQYRWFLFVFMMCYITTWFLFALLYYVNAFIRGDLGQEQVGTTQNKHGDQNLCYIGVDGFVSALLFSVETQRTIGYGSRTVSPTCQEGVLLVMMQCIVGSMIDALMVGCMFVKISRPKKRAETLLFSRTCVIANRDDQLCLMFRLGDLRESHMVDAKVRAKLIKSRQTTEGEFLPLEQTEIDLGYETGSDRLFLVEPQVIKHNIDVSSPLWELGPEQLIRQQFEIIVILEGIVEATGMMCQAKTSYIETEIEWGARFEPCMTLEKGSFRVDLRRFHTTYKVPLPNCSASQAHQLMVLAGCKAQSHQACKDWEAWAEGTAVEDKDKSPSHIRFTIGDIQEERMSEGNESEASAEQML
ncbi:G protein-activated inward rectifier potassium channel 3 isoform X2 [Fundulus heteroclitus]|uniref:G protein-activated inward rectifier potassium channel 3 isoform X2 n=1 Tax=Fundulus heteroclitus TaxID=8078 RepID=UPI00165C1EE9|nr:G protein-activated inward rectifier potassium channel 3 isoform X2 [Fundulus heteroclitus]XP_035988101.1 G protein-activated inward rectifier potassium channel 3 isoform X2 [Fundulus heteroclitus]